MRFASPTSKTAAMCGSESAQAARLSLEAPEPLQLEREILRQHLDGHLAPEPRVARPVHFPHPPDPSSERIS
jgi:hypothetical protein